MWFHFLPDYPDAFFFSRKHQVTLSIPHLFLHSLAETMQLYLKKINIHKINCSINNNNIKIDRGISF